MRKGILLLLGGLVLVAAGCGSADDKKLSIEPKWKGLPYRISMDSEGLKPNPTGVTLPGVKYTANPDALETRAMLVMRFAVKGPKEDQPTTHRMIGAPVDIKGDTGALPADYMDRASKGLSDYLASYCVQGKVNVSVALARSSLKPLATDAELDGKRLSDWQTVELIFKKPKVKC